MRMSLIAAVLLVAACSPAPAGVADRPTVTPSPAAAGPCEVAAALTRDGLQRAADAIPTVADDPTAATRELAAASEALGEPGVGQAVTRCRDADPQKGGVLSQGILAVSLAALDASTTAHGGSVDPAGMEKNLGLVRAALQVES